MTPPTTAAAEHEGPIELTRGIHKLRLEVRSYATEHGEPATTRDVIACLTANPQLRAAVLEGLGLGEVTHLREEYDKAVRLWKQATIDHDAAQTDAKRGWDEVHALMAEHAETLRKLRDAESELTTLRADNSSLLRSGTLRIGQLEAELAAERARVEALRWPVAELKKLSDAGMHSLASRNEAEDLIENLVINLRSSQQPSPPPVERAIHCNSCGGSGDATRRGDCLHCGGTGRAQVVSMPPVEGAAEGVPVVADSATTALARDESARYAVLADGCSCSASEYEAAGGHGPVCGLSREALARGEKDSSPSGAPTREDGGAERSEPRRSHDPDATGATYEPCLEFVFDTGAALRACSRPRGHDGAHNSRWKADPPNPSPPGGQGQDYVTRAELLSAARVAHAAWLSDDAPFRTLADALDNDEEGGQGPTSPKPSSLYRGEG
jgi:hypothetical protein